MSNASASQRISFLAAQIRAMESASRVASPQDALRVPGLESFFPHGALPRGAVVEIVSRRPGSGAWSLALQIARYACGDGKKWMLGDTAGCLYPPALVKHGLDLSRVVIVRSRNVRDLVSAFVQSLRCSAIGAIVGALERLATPEARRLQLAAESQAGIAVLLRPWTARSEPSFAEVRWAIEPIPSAERSRLGKRCLRVDILRMRGGQKGDSMFLEIDDATGSVRAFPSLAFAAHRADSTG